ncbi:unnamed protein product [Acanthoscelides obtectus]|uniref:Uncharacterized protein n=1 Tax=Acanthoscelides obtectus TaxID=200917 RepID=A0A9P0LMI0_ACAOB|nr:unnamed protein product [Acanthoscelides obtectus]CAK1627319.1 hypothetical protein AOBTE_LOCUS4514 [Acanthoscelides obtectus]
MKKLYGIITDATCEKSNKGSSAAILAIPLTATIARSVNKHLNCQRNCARSMLRSSQMWTVCGVLKHMLPHKMMRETKEVDAAKTSLGNLPLQGTTICEDTVFELGSVDNDRRGNTEKEHRSS